MARASTILPALTRYVIAFVEGVLLLRVLMGMLGASNQSTFVQHYLNITHVLSRWFEGAFPNQSFFGLHVESASAVAMIVYALAGFALLKLLSVVVPKQSYGYSIK